MYRTEGEVGRGVVRGEYKFAKYTSVRRDTSVTLRDI